MNEIRTKSSQNKHESNWIEYCYLFSLFELKIYFRRWFSLISFIFMAFA